jgi:pyridoxamine 5'-phosphate oxidase
MNADSIFLSRGSLPLDPIDQFNRWFQEAVSAIGQEGAEALCLSTVDSTGFPEGRMVLLKKVDAQGFVFYTNMHSAKGHALNATPKAALTFYWGPLQRQVRVQGLVNRVPEDEADAYFKSRARLSQIGAWASEQTHNLESRALLDQRVEEWTKKFEGQDVPRPAHWTGLRVTPLKIEFWQGRPNRLHDRFLYRKVADNRWEITQLYP